MKSAHTRAEDRVRRAIQKFRAMMPQDTVDAILSTRWRPTGSGWTAGDYIITPRGSLIEVRGDDYGPWILPLT